MNSRNSRGDHWPILNFYQGQGNDYKNRDRTLRDVTSRNESIGRNISTATRRRTHGDTLIFEFRRRQAEERRCFPEPSFVAKILQGCVLPPLLIPAVEPPLRTHPRSQPLSLLHVAFVVLFHLLNSSLTIFLLHPSAPLSLPIFLALFLFCGGVPQA